MPTISRNSSLLVALLYFANIECLIMLVLLKRLDGSIRGDKRKQALDHFNAEGSQVSSDVNTDYMPESEAQYS